MSQGPIDRCFGLSKVIVTTAGGDASINFLEYETARSITDALKKNDKHDCTGGKSWRQIRCVVISVLYLKNRKFSCFLGDSCPELV